MSRQLSILLLQPSWDGLSYRRKIKVNERAIHPLSLGVVAALSGNHRVRIIDEARELPPTSAAGFDVVGISVNTFNAPRAYRLADRYRAQKTPVVFGGPHTTLLPDECLQHAAAIVQGDAEDTWPQALEDVAAGKLKPRYVSALRDGTTIPTPRRDLFRQNSRIAAYVQITRGCLNQCRFCYLQYLPPAGLRRRDIGPVVAELQALRQRVVLFVDDNLFCEPAYAEEVWRAITPLRKRWWIQAPANLHHREGLIRLMARSGCYAVSIGFQTASNLVNEAEQIHQNRVEDYAALAQELHDHGILVDGTFIFGFDGDDLNTFAATRALIEQVGLDTYTFYFLTPYPGTDYFARFEREGRVLHYDWSRFDWDHVVLQPRQMTPEELLTGVRDLYQALDHNYFLRNAARRWPLICRACTSPSLLAFLADTSWNYYRSPILRE
jgi:radical SAM superfamily enzyme YgiQ (UPF0313 family)